MRVADAKNASRSAVGYVMLEAHKDSSPSVNSESRGAGCSAARGSHLNFPGNCSCRNRGCNLRIGVHREDSDFPAAEGHFASLRETVSGDCHLLPNRPAGWGEAEHRRRNPEFQVAFQGATRGNHVHKTGARPGGNSRGDVRIRHNAVRGIRAIKGDAGRSGEAATQNSNRLGNFPPPGEPRDEGLEAYSKTEKGPHTVCPSRIRLAIELP